MWFIFRTEEFNVLAISVRAGNRRSWRVVVCINAGAGPWMEDDAGAVAGFFLRLGF
jgi:hypothetical protein